MKDSYEQRSIFNLTLDLLVYVPLTIYHLIVGLECYHKS